MNNNSSSGIGCALLVVFIAILALFQWLAANPVAWILVIGIVIVIVAVRRATKTEHKRKKIAGYTAVADKLDALAEDKVGPQNISLSLRKDEKALFAHHGVSLVEYASTGSTYSGSSIGVSVPLFGNVRGNVGGQQGSITKNPEQPTIIDTGTAVFTTQRIVFTGAKSVRDWEFSKVLNLSVGQNGTSFNIAVSGRDKSSGLTIMGVGFGPGLAAGYSYTWYQEGEAAARKVLRETAQEMRVQVAQLQAMLDKNPEPVKPLNLDEGAKTEAPQVIEPKPDDPASTN